MSNIKLTSPSATLVSCQKAVQIKKKREPEGHTDVRLADIFKQDVFEASRNLKESGFKLYMYLISNSDGYVFGLSKVDVTRSMGISDASYNRAVNELIDKGYLTKTEQNAIDSKGQITTLFLFHARPLVNLR